ncbi:MAG TPA: outer membrane protein transport protein [Noviherbaspirillum sp.]|uniref:OmpP1/FadL family transporter n=1 Tax=Noviherbaspirillum sp. TaxID=1926288 RepID=UPI002D2A78C3|nr:outer membrane protein transport protein [Noviherbaspirillum sp.]HYD93951.1 outer membrane protein transport protein [Noviherbaspirillum sp.]
MSKRRRFRGYRTRLLPVASLLLASALPPAHAAMTDNLLTSPTAMSLGNAVTADPPGTDSIHFNPAGLARMTGSTESHSFALVSLRNPNHFTQGENFNIGGWREDPLNNTSTGPMRQKIYIPGIGMPGWRLPAVILPGLGLAYRKPDSDFTFGVANYVSQAMSSDRSKDPNDPGRFDGKLVHLQRLVYAAPGVGYKVSDTLSVGVSVPIAHQAIVMNTDMRMPNPLLGIVGQIQRGWCPENGGNILDTFTVGLCGGGPEGRVNPFKKAAAISLEMTAPVDPTINLGVLWEPVDWFALGAVYQGGSKTKVTGQYTITAEPMLRRFVEGMYSSLFGPIVAGITGMPSSIPEVQSGNATAVVPFPKRVQLGFKFKPTERFQFNVDANWADWGSWDAMTVKFDQSIKLLEMARLFGIPDSTQMKLPRGYKSTLHFGYGMQVKVNEKLTMRFGFEPRKSSIPADKIDLIAPLPDTKLYSIGANYKINRNTDISIAASYMKGDYNVPARGSCNMNCDNFFNIVYNPYAGLDVSGGLRVRYLGVTLTKHFD